MENLERCLYFIFIGGNHLNASRQHDGRCLPNAICVCACTCASKSQPQNVSNSPAFPVPSVVGPGSGHVMFSHPSDRRCLSAAAVVDNRIESKRRNGRSEWQQTQREAETCIPLGEGRGGSFSSRSRRRRHGDTKILRRQAAWREAHLHLSEASAARRKPAAQLSGN